MRCLVFLALAALAGPCAAQTFSVSLGATELGQMQYTAKGNTHRLLTTLDRTPLGVFNGSFVGLSSGTARSSHFEGTSRSSRKERVVQVTIDQGIVTATQVVPETEQTDLSDPARVAIAVVDPVRVIAHLVTAQGCPGAVSMYDGRRVTTLTPKEVEKSADTLTCSLHYRVVQGPGHLSPLGISSARMTVLYRTGAEGQTLQQIGLSSGVFRLTLNRR